MAAGSGSLRTSKRRTVPGATPEETASTTITRSAPCQASISEVPSPSCSSVAMTWGARSRRRRTASRPAASSRRYGLPTPITSTRGRPRWSASTGALIGLLPVYPQGEEVCGAGDAGVVVADSLLALPGEGVLREVDARFNESPEVRLDGLLVLCRGRYDLRVRDEALVVDGVAMVEDAARRLGAPVPRPRTRGDLHGRPLGRLVLRDQPQGLVAGVEGLHAAYNDALERVPAGRAQARGPP